MDLSINEKKKAFTVLELLVAVSVTALLAGMLLNITSQVVQTQTQASGNLETNQVAQFVLDRIQEDLQCAIFKNDGNVWMAADILNSSGNSGNWNERSYSVPKPSTQSLRVTIDHWPQDNITPTEQANKQGLLTESRFGMGGTWFRFFSQCPELDPQAENSGGVRAISYQILRYGLTSAENSTPKYQLFRSDISDMNTLKTGYNLHPDDGDYSNVSDNGPRESGNIQNPIYQINGTEFTDFSLASNIVDFGIRAYIIRNRPRGTGMLQQIFPDLNETTDAFSYLATSNPDYQTDSQKKRASGYAFPDVIDVMIRVLTAEGASALASFEEGLIPPPEGFNEEDYWWELVVQNSEVYTRRIRIFAKGL